MADFAVCAIGAVAAFFVGKFEKPVREFIMGFFVKD